MNIIKLIVALVGIAAALLALFSLHAVIGAFLWYGFWIAVIASACYGGYRLFRKAEDKFVGPGPTSYLDSRDFGMSWEEYDRKYLNK